MPVAPQAAGKLLEPAVLIELSVGLPRIPGGVGIEQKFAGLAYE
jgi:hypothetical protein